MARELAYLFDPDDVERLNDNLYRQWMPRMASGYVRAVNDTRKSAEVAALIEHVRSGDGIPWGYIHSVQFAYDAMLPVGRQLYDRTYQSSKKAITKLDFQVRDEDYLRRLADQTRQVFAGFTGDTRTALIRALQKAQALDLSTDELAEIISQTIGLDDRYALAVENYRTGLVSRGSSKSSARTKARQYAKRLLKARAQTVARTETMRIMQAAQRASYSETMDKLDIPASAASLQWIVTRDDKLCESCSPMNGEITTFESPSFQTPLGASSGPPLHPNCRCTTTVRYLRQAELNRKVDKGDYVGHPFRGNQWTGGWSAGDTPSFFMSDSERKAAEGEFDSLPADTLVVVFHGTSKSNASALRSTGVAGYANRGDAVSAVSAHRGLYVAPTRKDAEGYAGRGGEVVEIKVRRGDVLASPEAASRGKTVGQALFASYEGAIVRPGAKLQTKEGK